MRSEVIEPGKSVSIQITEISSLICSGACECGDLKFPVNAPFQIEPPTDGPITLSIKNVSAVGCTVELHPAPAKEKIEVDQSTPDIVIDEVPQQE